MADLTNAQRLILGELARLGQNGGLTGNMARTLFGSGTLSNSVRRPCLAMAQMGLVERHPQNDQRWFITPEGRAAIRPSHPEPSR